MQVLTASRRRSSGPRLSPVSDFGHALALIVDRLAAGDATAFSELYQATSGHVYGLALRVLRSPDHAAEVTQEVYLELWRQVSRYDPARGSVLAWISTMTHRRAIDRVRTVASATARDQRYAVGAQTRDVDGVWESVAARSDAAHVRHALTRLTCLQREALTLAYFGGQTQAQIATVLDLPLGTVKTRIRAGLINLRATLELDCSLTVEPEKVGY